VLDQMVIELAEKETLAKDDLERILAPVRKRPPHNTFGGFGKRTPSDRPPIEIPPSVRSNGSTNGAGPGSSTPPPPPDATAPLGPPPMAPPVAPAPPMAGEPPTSSRAVRDSGRPRPTAHGTRSAIRRAVGAVPVLR